MVVATNQQPAAGSQQPGSKQVGQPVSEPPIDGMIEPACGDCDDGYYDYDDGYYYYYY